MEQVENPMVMPQIEYDTDWEKEAEIWAEKEDRDYQDRVFERIMGDEECKN